MSQTNQTVITVTHELTVSQKNGAKLTTQQVIDSLAIKIKSTDPNVTVKSFAIVDPEPA